MAVCIKVVLGTKENLPKKGNLSGSGFKAGRKSIIETGEIEMEEAQEVKEISQETRQMINLTQYSLVPKFLTQPYDGDTGLQVVNHLVDRAELDNLEGIKNQKEFSKKVRDADEAFISAFNEASDKWKTEILSAVTVCEIDREEWWKQIEQNITS